MPLKYTGTILVVLALLLILAAPCMAAVSPGRITVYSTPSGALACIENATCDTTTATFTVEGNAWHSVVITQKGYRNWTDRVYVTSDQTSMLDAYLDLDPDATAINVSIHPAGGTVCLDNSDCRKSLTLSGNTGTTRFTGVSPGYHTVSVESPAEYQDAMQLVQVTLGKTTDVSIELNAFLAPTATTVTTPSLVPSTGTVRVYVDRTGSTICLDNTDCFINVGGSPGQGTGTAVFSDVPTDKAHIVSVTAEGYKSVSTPITVSKDMITTVDVTLLPATGATTGSPAVTGTSPAQLPVSPAAPTTRSAALPVTVIGALALCGAIILQARRQ